jgi:hypothetical protein
MLCDHRERLELTTAPPLPIVGEVNAWCLVCGALLDARPLGGGSIVAVVRWPRLAMALDRVAHVSDRAQNASAKALEKESDKGPKSRR